jgi:hypothetical protein
MGRCDTHNEHYFGDVCPTCHYETTGHWFKECDAPEPVHPLLQKLKGPIERMQEEEEEITRDIRESIEKLLSEGGWEDGPVPRITVNGVVVSDGIAPLLGKVFQEGMQIALQKNSDYSHGQDPFDNFRDFGVQGIVVRLGDKYKRAKNYFQKSQTYAVADESLRDTLMDMMNYAAIAVAMLDEKASK